MANTTNYNWETPDDTDLVKDGAAAIRTLGSSVDTTTKALNPSTTLGDIEYRSSTANTNTRLGIGTTGQILSVVAGVPAWVANDVGDITAVYAGTGISGGGTTGAVTITNSMATEITAAGDIIVGTGSGTFDNLPIGTTNQVLTADTTVSPYKVKWATPAGGASGLTKIIASTFSNVANTSTTFDGCFTSTYDNYIITFSRMYSSSQNVAFNFQLRVAGATNSSDYNGSYTRGASVTTTVGGSAYNVCNLRDNSAQASVVQMNFFRNTESMSWNYLANDRGVNDQSIFGGGAQNALGANGASGFILSAASGNIYGTVTVYGVEK